MTNGKGKKKNESLVILVGGIAQLGEHLLCKQGVRSSILLTSTKKLQEVIIHSE